MAIKLVFFDMEGTVFKHITTGNSSANESMWHKIVRELGPHALAEDSRMYRKWDEGGYASYMDWIEECTQLYKKEGLRKEIFTSVVQSMEYNEGVEETITQLHSKGIITALITGGFMAAAGRAQQHLRINHAFAAVKLFWNSDGLIDHWNILPANGEGKVDFVELLRKEYHFTKEECAFVGDGRNDIAIAKHVGLSFAYKAHPDLQKVATHSIEDMRDVLKYV